ncbi:MAG: hypothetical protein PUE13_01730 [Clostridiales bacterium]|nr:hypothetical protein [Clostridiales bacterium]
MVKLSDFVDLSSIPDGAWMNIQVPFSAFSSFNADNHYFVNTLVLNAEDNTCYTKQIIVAHLIDSISVKKGYELTVNFKISLEQFENGLEFQALSS